MNWRIAMKNKIVTFLLAILLFINFTTLIYDYNYIKNKSNQGNDRWHEVEIIIKDLEKRVEDLENGRNP